MLEVSDESVTSTLKRARLSLQRWLADGHEPAPDAGSDVERDVVEQLTRAFEADDLEGLVGLLTDDVWVRMPPVPLEYQGRELAEQFFAAVAFHRGRVFRLVETRANGQPAFGVYVREPGARDPSQQRAGGVDSRRSPDFGDHPLRQRRDGPLRTSPDVARLRPKSRRRDGRPVAGGSMPTPGSGRPTARVRTASRIEAAWSGASITKVSASGPIDSEKLKNAQHPASRIGQLDERVDLIEVGPEVEVESSRCDPLASGHCVVEQLSHSAICNRAAEGSSRQATGISMAKILRGDQGGRRPGRTRSPTMRRSGREYRGSEASKRGVPVAEKALAGGTFAMAEDLTVTRMGYGAMQLAGPGVFGPPTDRAGAVAVLREVVELGITHIDTSDFYGPYVTNQIIKEALHPYPDSLHIVTKVGARRDADGGWLHARSPEELRQAVHDNLDHLGLDALDVVNLRVGGLGSPEAGSIAEQFETLAELQQTGLIRHLGAQHRQRRADRRGAVDRAGRLRAELLQRRPPCRRRPDRLPRRTGNRLRALLPTRRLQSSAVRRPAISRHPRSVPHRWRVALAWLLQRSPNILLIPGTSSVAHLHENVTGAALTLSEDELADLNLIAERARPTPRPDASRSPEESSAAGRAVDASGAGPVTGRASEHPERRRDRGGRERLLPAATRISATIPAGT